MDTPAAKAKARRIRRLPRDAQREILDAAEALLADRSFHELSVDDVMARTGMTRSSFYHYFRSLDEVAVGLLRGVQAEMMDAVIPWLGLREIEDPVRDLQRGIRDTTAIFASHALVLTAIHEASVQHETVQDAWRHGVLGDWIRTVAAELRRQRQMGLTRVENPEEVARALLLMNTAVFVERLGKVPPDSPESVARTLSQIWIGAIYPEALARRRAR